jgi:exonuclease SbcC
MRPHRLVLTAFGPFAGTVEVDLDVLSSAGVFLLHGETGAGKTTLLDGLGFALYGRVPGERGKAKRLRSDHAPDGVRTAVELEVTLAGRRLRVLRSPQQDKPSSRGGTTTVQAKVQLDELVDGTWGNLSTRVGEADTEISDLMGMSAEQFFQVVLLPQGEFARFLRADSAERGALLQRLFGTDRFRAVEDWLADRRRLTAAQVEQAEQQLEVLAARLAQAASVEPAEELTPDWAARTAADGRGLLAVQTAAEEAARGALSAARAQADAAALLAARQDRRRAALLRQDRLRLARPEVDLLAEELAAAARAAAVAPLLTEHVRRQAALAGCLVAEAEARAAAPAGDLTALLPAERLRLGRLEGLRDVAEDLAREESVARAAGAERATAEAAAAQAERALLVLPERRALLEEQLATARSATARLPERQARLVVLRGAVADAAALAGAQADQRLHRDELTLAREGAVALQEKVVDIREARVDSMIAELAATLEDGAPCPVCGSDEHPDPSLLLGARVTRDDEDAAQTAYEVARQQVEHAAAALAAAEATATGLAARLDEAGLAGVAADALAAERDALLNEIAELTAGAAGGTAAEEQLAGLDAERSALELSRTEATAAASAAARRADEAAARAAAARSRLAAEFGDAPDLPAALVSSADVIAAAERALACAEDAARAAEECADAGRAAAAAATAAGFADAAAAAAAVRDDAWRTAAQERLRAADAEAVAVQTLLADPELAVPLEPVPDLPAAVAALADAERQHRAAAGARATARAAAAAVDALVPDLLAALADLEPLRERATEVRRLADLCAGTSGSNTLRMSLSSFVLAARLEEVALAASERLLRMTQGRYSLVHTDIGRGGGRSGLGLLARDTWTGQDRETSTLSGGETFLASLALALGLADVVAAEAGGARIEALFVDEGFGTLDEDTLDEVMDVLDGLREGGRVVGLVSHVAELRQRIPAQVHVRKGRSGSDLAVLGC